MRLYNNVHLLKMLIPDRYELFLFKLGIHLFFKLGVVKFRGDRYVYNGSDVIRIVGNGDFVEITLLNPVVHNDDKVELEGAGGNINNTLYIEPGSRCGGELEIIHEHIRNVNILHNVSQYISEI
tara:strand:+ start:460 stop:831 length:372 start_codon:yes stop_codon:yes gene_type:complete